MPSAWIVVADTAASISPANESGVAVNLPALPASLLALIDHSLYLQYPYTSHG